MKRLLILPLLACACFAQGLDYIKAHYTKYEYRIPMRDGKTPVHRPSTSPRTPRRSYPILLTARRTTWGRTGWTITRPSLGPSEKFARESFIFVYQDVRGRYMSEGDFVDMRPHDRSQARAPGHGRKLRHLRHDRLADQATSRQQRQRGDVGDLVPGVLHRRGDHRRPPGAKGGLAAGAHRRLVRGRRLPSQRSALPAARLTVSSAASGIRAPSRRCRRRPLLSRVPANARTATASSFRWVRSPMSTRSTSRTMYRSGPR